MNSKKNGEGQTAGMEFPAEIKADLVDFLSRVSNGTADAGGAANGFLGVKLSESRLKEIRELAAKKNCNVSEFVRHSIVLGFHVERIMEHRGTENLEGVVDELLGNLLAARVVQFIQRLFSSLSPTTIEKVKNTIWELLTGMLASSTGVSSSRAGDKMVEAWHQLQVEGQAGRSPQADGSPTNPTWQAVREILTKNAWSQGAEGAVGAMIARRVGIPESAATSRFGSFIGELASEEDQRLMEERRKQGPGKYVGKLGYLYRPKRLMGKVTSTEGQGQGQPNSEDEDGKSNDGNDQHE